MLKFIGIVLMALPMLILIVLANFVSVFCVFMFLLYCFATSVLVGSFVIGYLCVRANSLLL